MKLIAVLFCISVVSCSTIENNSPAFQGLNNNTFFKAAQSRVVIGENGGLIIRGENGNGESVNLVLGSQGETQVSLGASVNNPNIAVYTDQFGNQYSTAFEDASGVVNYITNGSASVSGEFKFTAFTTGKLDTVVFSKGFMFEVPFVTAATIDIPDADVQDSFTARINTAIFNPTIISQNISSNVLTIIGQTSSVSMSIVLPADTTPGNYVMEEGTTIFGAYINEMGNNVSTSGTLQIISNDTTENIISGEFAFETMNGFSITDGAFVINY